MIAGLERVALPRHLVALCDAMAVRSDGVAPQPVDYMSTAAALSRFRDGFWQPESQPLASLWSMYYFNSLIIPAIAALLCRDHVVPLAIEQCGLEADDKGLPRRIWVETDASAPFEPGRRFDALVNGHLVPFIASYADETGVTSRVLWSNAATILDYAVDAVAGLALPEPLREAEALLAGTGRTDTMGRLAEPLRMTEAGVRERRICCTRYRLSGVAPCAVVCPAREASMRQGAGA